MKEQGEAQVAKLVARQADAIVCAADAIAEETRGFEPRGRVLTIANGSDFDDFAGLEHHASDRFRITHTGSFFGKRSPRPFLEALARSGLEDVVARFVGDFRSADREWAEELGLGDRLELIPYVPRRRSLELQRDSEALLLLIPEAAGRGKGVLSGKVFEYLAAERPVLAVVPPDGAAAGLIRETGAGVVAPPEDVDAIAAAARRAARPLARGAAERHAALRCLAREALPREPRRGARRPRPGARVTAVAVPRPRALADHSALTDALFLGTLFSVSFAKLHWTVGGDLSLADVLTALFLVAWGSERLAAGDTRVDRTAATVLGFFAAFLLVYLAGWFNMDTQQELAQWGKGMVKFVLHFLFVVAGVAYLARRSERAYWRALAAFMLGIAANAAYGVVQLAVARVGINLDELVLRAAHARRERDQRLRRGRGAEGLPHERAHGRSRTTSGSR